MNLNKLVEKMCIKSRKTGAHKILGAHCLRQEWDKVLGGVVLYLSFIDCRSWMIFISIPGSCKSVRLQEPALQAK